MCKNIFDFGMYLHQKKASKETLAFTYAISDYNIIMLCDNFFWIIFMLLMKKLIFFWIEMIVKK